MERWQWAAEQRRNTTKCDFTINHHGGSNTWAFFSSCLGIIFATPFLSPGSSVSCSRLLLLLPFATARSNACLAGFLLLSRHNNIVICRLSFCPSLPAPLLDGYHRLFSRGASRLLSTCYRLRKSSASSHHFYYPILKPDLPFFLSFVRSLCGVISDR